MAIEAENNIQQFVSKATELFNYTSSANMVGNPLYDSKYSHKLGREVDKIVKNILKSQSEIDDFVKLLDDKSLLTQYLAAGYLYPIYPNKCLKIMKKFYSSIDDKIDKFTVKTKIEGLLNKESFFIDTYKKLYKCEDIECLSRE